jgi:tetratricopeptide (TPR) repeat protein
VVGGFGLPERPSFRQALHTLCRLLPLRRDALFAQVRCALDRCEGLARLSLLQEVGAGRFAFAHALVRTTVLERMSSSRRAYAHREVAEAIEARGGADHDELAHHWTQAGVEDRAFASLERAAERDLEAFAFESAVERYRDLLDYHRDDPTGDARARTRAWLGLGRGLRAVGNDEFLAAVGEAGRLARRLHDVDLLTDAALAGIWPGNFYVTAGDIDTEKAELAEDAIALLAPDDPRRARVLATLASQLTFDPDRDRRVALLAEAEAIARQVGDPELIGTVLVAEHLALWHASTSDRRAEIGVEVGRLARASGDVVLEFFGGFLQAFSALEHGRLDDVRRCLERLDEPITASQNPYFAFLAERLGVTMDVFLGHPDAQARVDALAATYDKSYADTAGTWAIQTGHLAIQAGRLGDFVPSLRPMVEGARVSNWWTAFGLALHHAGEREEAEAVLDRMTSPPLDYFWLPTTQMTAELALGLGRIDRAGDLYDELLPYAALMGITASGSACMGFVSTTLGELALALGQTDAAFDHLSDAVSRSEAVGAPYESTKARRLLGQAHLAAGERSEGEICLRIARERAEQHGLAGEQALLAVDA